MSPTDGIAKALRAAEAMARTAIAAGMQALRRLRGHRLRDRARRGPRGRDDARAHPHGHGRARGRHLGPEGRPARRRPAPARPRPHQYAVTEPLPELAGETREVAQPILRHQDADLYYRQLGDAYGIGNYDHEPRLDRAEDDQAVGRRRAAVDPPVHARGLRPRRRGDRAAAARRRPRPRVRAFDGLMSFTPDGMPLIGEAAAARGLWLCEAIWVTHSGGAGRRCAELIARGDALTDMHECDPQRFDAHGLSRTYARPAARSSTARSTTSLHPRQQSEQVRAAAPHAAVPAPARARRALLRERRLGAAAVVRGQRRARPRRGPAAPRLARAASGRRSPPASTAPRRERVGLFDLTPFTKVEVRGPGALAFLQDLAANDVDRPLGTIVYTAMCAPARRDHVRPRRSRALGRGPLPRRHRRRGRPPRHRVDDAPPAVGRLRRARGQDVGALLHRALGPAGARPRSPRCARTTSPTRRSRT